MARLIQMTLVYLRPQQDYASACIQANTAEPSEDTVTERGVVGTWGALGRRGAKGGCD